MNEKIIRFTAHKDYFKLNEELPKAVKLNIPDWFKKLEHSTEAKTVKGCIPFLQTLTYGYVFSLPQDFILKHNSFSKDEIKTTLIASIEEDYGYNLNVRDRPEQHSTEQIKGSPYSKKNSNLFVNKILNPWIIKTPPGYSCLFVSPLNNSDDRFSIIPGIVDTDTFPLYINFPFVVNGDKYPVLDTELKKGTPYVQVIPFKRDSWKMNIGEIEENSKNNFWLKKGKYFLQHLHNYKNLFWNKKTTWK
jgi:hypothetical protein|tara:strand:- start:7684 stop:8424 length:741 start_codon:yes stop_codon:yes gene_type:complete